MRWERRLTSEADLRRIGKLIRHCSRSSHILISIRFIKLECRQSKTCSRNSVRPWKKLSFQMSPCVLSKTKQRGGRFCLALKPFSPYFGGPGTTTLLSSEETSSLDLPLQASAFLRILDMQSLPICLVRMAYVSASNPFPVQFSLLC